jgi:hypothetical protein
MAKAKKMSTEEFARRIDAGEVASQLGVRVRVSHSSRTK